MKTICLFLSIILSVVTVLSQPKANLSGNWVAKSGTPDNPGEVYFHFTHFADSLKIKVSLPMFGDKYLNMPLPAISLKNDTIRFATFDGMYLPEKDKISAKINFLYEAIPFTLSRIKKVGKPVLDTAKVSGRQPFWTFEADGRVWSSPVFHNEQLFFRCDDSCLYSLNPANGQLIRKFRTGGKVRGKASISGENLVFASDDGLVYCLNSKTGKLVWKYSPSQRIWQGVVHLKSASMKFRANHSWDYNYGSDKADGKLGAGAANIPVAVESDYAITLDLSQPNAYTYTANRWGVIGDATPGGWSTDTNMTWDSVNKVLKVTLNLTVGAFKFRANDDWAVNVGGNLGALTQGGANIPIAVAGNYTITLDVSKAAYSATVTKN